MNIQVVGITSLKEWRPALTKHRSQREPNLADWANTRENERGKKHHPNSIIIIIPQTPAPALMHAMRREAALIQSGWFKGR